jgi:hypothetical protein
MAIGTASAKNNTVSSGRRWTGSARNASNPGQAETPAWPHVD